MRAEPGHIDGNLEWTKQAYLLTNSAIRHWDFPKAQTFRICNVAKHLTVTRLFGFNVAVMVEELSLRHMTSCSSFPVN